jgi:hypothetical protein
MQWLQFVPKSFYCGYWRKAIAVTRPGGPKCCETSKFPHFLYNRLIYGGEVISVTHRPPFTSQDYSWYSFLLEAESTLGP